MVVSIESKEPIGVLHTCPTCKNKFGEEVISFHKRDHSQKLQILVQNCDKCKVYFIHVNGIEDFTLDAGKYKGKTLANLKDINESLFNQAIMMIIKQGQQVEEGVNVTIKGK
jgi:hypothetical protein